MKKLKITLKHSGKMEGMQSLSTLSFTNPLCEKNKKIGGSVCSKCYVTRALRYKNNQQVFIDNADILTKSILKYEELPLLNVAYFRFEAFGELINHYQLINYINICKKNKTTHFALWSKNYELIKSYEL